MHDDKAHRQDCDTLSSSTLTPSSSSSRRRRRNSIGRRMEHKAHKLILLVFMTSSAALGTACPTPCNCKWKTGKQTVECQHKSLMTIPEGIDTDTQVLDLSYNNFQRIPERAFALVKLTNLQRIYLASCKLGEIDPEAFAQLTNLVELDLQNNLLHEVPSLAFKNIPELLRLHLDRNPITTISEGTFRYTPYLTQIYLSHCRITTISANAFHNLKLLKGLHLQSNRLTELRPQLVQSLQGLHNVGLHNNSWACDCRLRPLRKWLVDKRVHEMSPKCTSPPRIKGIKFEELNEDDFACQPEILPTGRHVRGVVGSNTTVWCPVAGLPTPKVDWYVRDALLTNGSLVGVGGGRGFVVDEASEERGSLLVMVGATEEDSGMRVRCQATNPAGVAHAEFELYFAPRPIVLAPFITDRIAVISTVLVVVLVILVIILFVVARRRRRKSSHTPVPHAKTLHVNGTSSGAEDPKPRLTDLEYTTNSYTSGSVMVASDNPDLLVVSTASKPPRDLDEPDGRSMDEMPLESTPPSNLHEKKPVRVNGHAARLVGSLSDGEEYLGSETRLYNDTYGSNTVWAPERVEEVLNSTAPEQVMHASLHEHYTPLHRDQVLPEALTNTAGPGGGGGAGGAAANNRFAAHRMSFLPNYAPDFSEFHSYSQVATPRYSTDLNGVSVMHYGTLPRAVKTRSGGFDQVPGDGTPTMLRRPNGQQQVPSAYPLNNGKIVALPTTQATPPKHGSPPVLPYSRGMGGPVGVQVLPTHPSLSHNKINRITARDSPDEGYQEGADV